MGKSILKSKTFWFNIAAAALTVAAAKTGNGIDPALQAGLIAGGNTLLRLITSKPITLGD